MKTRPGHDHTTAGRFFTLACRRSEIDVGISPTLVFEIDPLFANRGNRPAPKCKHVVCAAIRSIAHLHTAADLRSQSARL